MMRYISLKLLYFLQAAGGAPILPFLPVILKQLGVTGTGFGFGLALIGLTGIVARPITSSLIDKYKRRRALCFKILIFGSIIGFGTISQLPSVKEREPRPNLAVYGCDHSPNTVNDTLRLISSKSVGDVCTLDKLRELKQYPIACDFSCDDKNGNPFNQINGEIFMSTAKPVSIEERKKQSIDNTSNKNMYGDDLFIFETSVSCENNLNSGDAGLKLFKCGLNCPNDIEVTNMLMLRESHSLFANVRYWIIIFCWMMGAVCVSSIAPIQDTICHQILNQPSADLETETFGQQRLFASLGWGSFAFISGYLIKTASETSIFNNYTPSFLLMAFLWSLSAYTTGKLGLDNENTENEAKLANSNFKTTSNQNENTVANIKDTLYFLFSSPRYVTFLVYVMVGGSCLGCMSVHFLLLDELGQQGDCNASKAIKFLQGLCIAIQCTGELPIFKYSGQLIDRFGVQVVSYVVLLAYLVRFSWYGSYLTSPWQTVYVEPIHGICIGLFFSTLSFQAMEIANDMKKKEKGSETTVMGLVYSANDLGVAFGGWAAGVSYENYRAASTFQLMSYFVLFMLCLIFLLNRMIR